MNAPRPRLAPRLIVSIAVGAVVMSSACTGQGEQSTAPGTESALATQRTGAQVNLDDTDPRALATYIVDRASQGDIHAVRDLLVSEFQPLSDTALQDAVLNRYRGNVQTSDWDVELFEATTTVRMHDWPTFALVFQHQTDGSLRLDPGPFALESAMVRDQSPHPAGTGAASTPPSEEPVDGTLAYQREIQVMAGPSDQVSQFFSESLGSVVIQANRVIVSFSWTFQAGAKAELPYGNSHWRSSDNAGVAEILLTTATRSSSHIEFLAHPDKSNKSSQTYLVSFLIDDLPASDEIDLDIADIIIVTPDDGRLQFSIQYTLPNEPYPRR